MDSLSEDEKAIDSKWVKTDGHGYAVKAEARLVLRGDNQERGEILTFSPTPSSTTHGVSAVVACAEGKRIFHSDVGQAFVHSVNAISRTLY